MANQAAFTINGTPSADPVTGDRQYTAVNGETLTVELEVDPSPALSATFEVFNPLDLLSPQKSKNTPDITWNENGLPAITVGPPPFGINDPVTIDIPAAQAPPLTGIYTYVIRCTVSTAGDGSPGSQVQVFTRAVLVFSQNTTPAIRKTFPGETDEARARAWSDAINDMVDAIEQVGGGGGGGTPDQIASAAGQYTVPGAVNVGDLVYATGVNTADVADNGAEATTPAIGIVIAKPLATTATLAYLGEVTGLAGMTPGAIQYLGSSGGLVEAGSLPSTPGSVIQQVGVALTATKLLLDPQNSVTL
jgi:hypothetical protein